MRLRLGAESHLSAKSIGFKSAESIMSRDHRCRIGVMINLVNCPICNYKILRFVIISLSEDQCMELFTMHKMIAGEKNNLRIFFCEAPRI